LRLRKGSQGVDRRRLNQSIMAHKKHRGVKGKAKNWASKRTMNTPAGPGPRPDTKGVSGGAGFQEHDAKNRLGSFASAGEHARTGNPGHQ
jgi:hypothetical protein